MATASKTLHRGIDDLALPYITNSSVISTNPQWVMGSTNILTGQTDLSERRPGFSEEFLNSFTNLQRQFIWRKWSGSFIWMGCDIDTTAKVYKFEIGVDTVKTLLWTSTSTEPFDFVVSNNVCLFGNGTDMKRFDGSAINNWGFSAPVAGPGITLISGTSNVYTSWCYCYTYWRAANTFSPAHESSPSPISACSGVFTNKTAQLALVASTDSQVTGIRVYRTPDGGSQDPSLMKEIANSPFPNTTGTVNDATPDVSLSIRTAPPFFRNDPPVPQMGFVAYGGRIWGFKDNQTFYSDFEETADPSPEECWAGGLDGNFYPWANEVTAHATLADGIAVFTAERISKIEGDSLDTFRRYTLLERRGTRNRNSVVALGGSVAWFDTAGQVWVSDLGEVGSPIRPDTQVMDQRKVEIAIHIKGIFHWLVLLDGGTGRLFVYDIDNQQWMPPWTVGNTCSALVSAEMEIGIVELMVARNNTKSLKLVEATYQDDGTPYESVAITNMWRMTPEGNPSLRGVLDWTEIKTDTNPPSAVGQLTDDDPTLVPFADITANTLDSPDIMQGRYLKTTRYTSQFPAAQLIAMKFSWDADSTNFKLYQLDVSFHPVGG